MCRLSQKILFVHNALTTFVARDLEILQGCYQVEEYFVKSDWLNPWRDFRKVYRAELVFCWFASAHSFLPVLFAWLLRKPSVVVIGGYDVVNMPEINYGHQRGGLKKWLSRLIFRLATLLIAVSEFNQTEAIKNANVLARKLRLIYNAVPINQVYPASDSSRSSVLTVGNVSESNLERKGLRLFVESARFLPDVPFVVAGKWVDAGAEKLKRMASPNVTFTGLLSDEELSATFDRAGIYVQASRHEAFGVAVAEAMLHGCIPVLSRSGALPEVGGDCAVYLAESTPEVLATTINQALSIAIAEPERAEACRQRIRENFSLDLRRQKLCDLLNRLLNKDLRPNA